MASRNFEQRVIDRLVKDGDNPKEARRMVRAYTNDALRLYGGPEQRLTPRQAADIVREFSVADAGNGRGMYASGNSNG